MSSTSYLVAVCYGEGKFVAIGKYGKCLYSKDGGNWIDMALTISAQWTSLCYNHGRFVAVSANTSSKTPTAAADATPSAISQLSAMGLTRMQLVSYVGTGTYTATNPCSLTFDFAPKVVLYLGASPDNASTLDRYTKRAMFADGLTTNNTTYLGFSKDTANYPGYGGKSADGKTFHWYAGGSAEYQLNKSGTTYYFLALA